MIKDYRPLLKYLDLLTPSQRNEVLPSNKDFEVVSAMALTGVRKLTQIMQELARLRIKAIDEELAVEAIRRAWGVELDGEMAVKEISKEIAGWVLEICEGLGLIKLGIK